MDARFESRWLKRTMQQSYYMFHSTREHGILINLVYEEPWSNISLFSYNTIKTGSKGIIKIEDKNYLSETEFSRTFILKIRQNLLFFDLKLVFSEHQISFSRLGEGATNYFDRRHDTVR